MGIPDTLPPLEPMRLVSKGDLAVIRPLVQAAKKLTRTLRRHNNTRWHLDRLPMWMQGRGDPCQIVWDRAASGLLDEDGRLVTPKRYQMVLAWLQAQPALIKAAIRHD